MWDPGGPEVSELSVTSDDLSRAGSRVVDSVVCSSCSEEDSARECYVRLLLQVLHENIPRSVKRSAVKRVFDPRGHDARMLSRDGELGRVMSQSLDRNECGGVLAVEVEAIMKSFSLKNEFSKKLFLYSCRAVYQENSCKVS